MDLHPKAKAIALAVRQTQGPVLIAVHTRPDMDAIASALAIAAAVRRTSRQAITYSEDPLPPHIASTPAGRTVVTCKPPPLPPAGYSLVVAVECQTPQRGGQHLVSLASVARGTVLVDHHADCEPWAAISWIDPEMPSCSEMAYQVHLALAGPPDSQIATYLLAGIAGDTLWFSVPGITPATFRTAAELLQWGAQPSVARTWTSATGVDALRAEASALANVRDAGEGVYWTYSESADPTTRYRLAEALISLDGCRVAVVACGGNGHPTVVSIKSNDGTNVRSVAAAFGGGGHSYAAAFQTTMPPTEAARQAAECAVRLVREDRLGRVGELLGSATIGM